MRVRSQNNIPKVESWPRIHHTQWAVVFALNVSTFRIIEEASGTRLSSPGTHCLYNQCLNSAFENEVEDYSGFEA